MSRSTRGPQRTGNALRASLMALSISALAACGPRQAPPAPPPPQVAVVLAHSQSVPLTRSLVGRLSATRSADVRARVAGVLQKRLYTEGSDVKEGQPLFQIDPAPLRAALDGAQASLAQAEAQATNAHIAAQRTRDLLPSGLVSRSDLDNAEASERATAAAVQQARAAVGSARINLGYATVTAPIAGRSGQQGVTEGALVGQGTATLLTTVEQIDPIYVNFDQPSIEIQRLRRQQSDGAVTVANANQATVQLLLEDGTPYAHTGALDFRDLSVDPATGAVALRAIVPNPDHVLLPGMFVGVRLTSGAVNRGFLVPQAGLQRDGNGPYVLIVGPDDKVLLKRVTVDGLQGQDWIVTDGLTDGDRMILTGTQNAHPGSKVLAVPYQGQAGGAPAGSAPAAAGK